MNNLCTDIGYRSINKYGEELCGDHVDCIDQGNNSDIVVLADGMGSGVKACILSTLTSKIISTMMASEMSLVDCVSTIGGNAAGMFAKRGGVFHIYHYTYSGWQRSGADSV